MDESHHIHTLEYYTAVKIRKVSTWEVRKPSCLHAEEFESLPLWCKGNFLGSCPSGCPWNLQPCWRVSVTGSATHHRLGRCPQARMLTAGSHTMEAATKSPGTRKRVPSSYSVVLTPFVILMLVGKGEVLQSPAQSQRGAKRVDLELRGNKLTIGKKHDL